MQLITVREESVTLFCAGESEASKMIPHRARRASGSTSHKVRGYDNDRNDGVLDDLEARTPEHQTCPLALSTRTHD